MNGNDYNPEDSEISFCMATERDTVTKTFRFPGDLAEDLTARAAQEHLSLNAYVLHVLLGHVDRDAGESVVSLGPSPEAEPVPAGPGLGQN
jgi:hypothetical protein